MNNTPFTIEEENLICIFDVSNRTVLIHELRDSLSDFDEPELREIAENTIRKLNAISDAEFAELVLTPVYNVEESEETEVPAYGI